MLGYTLAQARAFLAAIDRQERERAALLFSVLVTAQHGTRKDVERLFKDLLSQS